MKVEEISLLLSVCLSVCVSVCLCVEHRSVYLCICLFSDAETNLGKSYKTLAIVITFRDGDWGAGVRALPHLFLCAV